MGQNGFDFGALIVSTITLVVLILNYLNSRSGEWRDHLTKLQDDCDRLEGKIKNLEAQLEFARGDANFQRLRADQLYDELRRKRGLGYGDESC